MSTPAAKPLSTSRPASTPAGRGCDHVIAQLRQLLQYCRKHEIDYQHCFVTAYDEEARRVHSRRTH